MGSKMGKSVESSAESRRSKAKIKEWAGLIHRKEKD